LAELDKLSRIEYGQRRKEAANTLGINLSTLDRAVAELRAHHESELHFLPHWNVGPWPEEIAGETLLNALRQYFTRYVVLPAHTDVALALWTICTYVFECFDITPYLSITSPTRRCGKTVLMTLLCWLCRRGKKSDSMSKAAIYRSVDSEKPTLVLDEVGWVLDPKDERQGVLCGGFERNGFVEVCEGEGVITTRRFSTYCPKAFGLIGKLTATLTDRSIEIRMRRKTPAEKVERLRRRDNDEHLSLRQQCLRWANDNAQALATSSPPLPDKLNDRAADFWEPLLAVADLAGGKWPEAARSAALALSGETEADDDTRLLRDIRWILDGKPKAGTDGDELDYSALDQIPSADLVSHLIKIEDSPWADWRSANGFTQNALARLLTRFHVEPKNIRVGGKVLKATNEPSSMICLRPIFPQLQRFKPLHRYKPITTGISCKNQTATSKTM
jgi:putative DNA primase/helicase